VPGSAARSRRLPARYDALADETGIRLIQITINLADNMWSSERGRWTLHSAAGTATSPLGLRGRGEETP
jgi:hypothetical protein